jgi:hypothetical protein
MIILQNNYEFWFVIAYITIIILIYIILRKNDIHRGR